MLLYACGVIFGPEMIYQLLVYVQILRIVLAGLAVYGFLSCFALSERSKLIASYIYALCGYMVVWGQHYQFGTLMVLLPLLLLAAEKALAKPRWYFWGYTFVRRVRDQCAVFQLYAVYCAGRLFFVPDLLERKAFLQTGFLKLAKGYGSMLLGIGIGLVNLLPSGSAIVNVSGRVTAKPLTESFWTPSALWAEFYKTLFKKILLGQSGGDHRLQRLRKLL